MSVAAEGSGSGVKARAVELCQCPPGHDGTSCEVSHKTATLNIKVPKGRFHSDAIEQRFLILVLMAPRSAWLHPKITLQAAFLHEGTIRN